MRAIGRGIRVSHAEWMGHSLLAHSDESDGESMKSIILSGILFAACIAHADDQVPSGVAADAASTAAGLAQGASEANPLGLVTVPIRLVIHEHTKTMPREDAQPINDALNATGWGAAAYNLLFLAGAGPAAPVAGLAVVYSIWKSGETEREFWHLCAVHKQMDPSVKCAFKAWTPEDVNRLAAQTNR
jgi:hypothetical protein